MTQGTAPAAPTGSPKEVVDLINGLNASIEDGWKKIEAKQSTLEEELRKIQAQHAELQQKARSERHRLPDDSPLGDEDEKGNSRTGDVLATKGGWRRLGIDKALTLPSNHAIMRKMDAGDIEALHDYHDAVVMKYWIKWYKGNRTQSPDRIWESLTKDVDFVEYAQLREALGLGTVEDLKQAHAKGLVNTGWNGDTFRKANEIQNPALHTTLDFTLLSSQLIQKMRLDLVVASQFRRFAVSRKATDIPTLTADGMGVWGNTTIPPTATSSHELTPIMPTDYYWTKPTFSKQTFTVEHLLAYLVWNDDMEEQSIVDWVPIMRDQAAYSAARAYDRAVLDGDETGTHRDADTTAAGVDFRGAIYGLRMFSANYDFSNYGEIFDVDAVHALRASLGIYGVNSGALRLFVPLKLWYQLVGAANVANNASGDILRRVDTIGDRATILTGQVGSVYGIPVLVSEFVRTNTHTDGVYTTGEANDRAIAVLADSRSFATGQFNEVRIETTRFAPILTNVIQTDVRVDFQPFCSTGLTSGSFTSGGTDVPCNVLFNCA